MRTDLLPSKNSLRAVHDHLMLPYTYTLMEIEKAGFKIDRNMLDKLTAGYSAKINDLEDDIRSFPEVLRLEKRLGKKIGDFNVNSPDQVRVLLFEELGISENGVPRTGLDKPSTKKEVIERLRSEHEIIELLHQHRKYATLNKMFIKPMPHHIMPDGRVHSSYLQNGTVTGRLSSEKPNMQQIPKNVKPEELGFDFDPELNIKHMFVPSTKDHVLLQADYSQMELRILAEYCQDEGMIETFLNRDDIHLATAEILAGKKVDRESYWRRVAKNVNFGIIYGQTPRALGAALKISEVKAKNIIDDYLDKMPKVRDWIQYCREFCEQNELVTSMFGRVRRLAGVSSRDEFIREEAYRRAVNSPIQSSADDYMKCSSMVIAEFLEEEGFKTKIAATVHDNLIFDAHKKELKNVVDAVETMMIDPPNDLIYWDGTVELAVDFEVGDSWATLEPYRSN